MRTRLLKEEWFKDETIAELPAEARLLFMGLHCFADREGRFEWRPKRIRIEIFPYDARQDTERLLQSLLTAKLIGKYETAGHVFGFIPSFGSQKIHPHEKQSVIPANPVDVITCNDIEVTCQPSRAIVEVEVEVDSKREVQEGERQVMLAPRIVMKASEQVALIAEFGERQVTLAAQTASDWLLSEGKTKKNYAAFLRNWLRRDTQSRPRFQNSRERNEAREALAMERLALVEASGAESLFHVGLCNDIKKLGGK
jgi:hypothetical protein